MNRYLVAMVLIFHILISVIFYFSLVDRIRLSSWIGAPLTMIIVTVITRVGTFGRGHCSLADGPCNGVSVENENHQEKYFEVFGRIRGSNKVRVEMMVLRRSKTQE